VGRWSRSLSADPNLVPGDTNGTPDVFVHDVASGLISRVSVGTGGIEANGSSITGPLSTDGRRVAFTSDAANLGLPGDPYDTDVYVYDTTTGVMTPLSAHPGSAGYPGNSTVGAMSADGRIVAFGSDVPVLVAGDTEAEGDAFLVRPFG
jgi:Tol biopolymer transport system component